MWRHLLPKDENRTGDQRDAYCIAAWLSRSDRDDSLATYLAAVLDPRETAQARVEEWIFGGLGQGAGSPLAGVLSRIRPGPCPFIVLVVAP